MYRALWIAPALFVSLLGQLRAADAPDPPITYEKHVRPILKANCFQCHGENGEREGQLDLRLRRLIAKGGESGPAIIPGNSDKSLLLTRIRNGEMPPGEDKRLTAQEIAVIAGWIAAGAKTAHDEPKEIGDGPLLTHEERTFWSFRPITRPVVPEVSNMARVQSAIDAFLLARLEKRRFSFSSDASRRTLIRRAHFDLLGLPPSPGDVRAFLDDSRPDAYERLIDRLLASPHYGERWGRHWLDVAGYADSEGYTDQDVPREWAFRYRDYVIRSFNSDKPFDLFVHEQLAGDELVAPPYRNLTADEIEQLTATGFLRMAPDGTGVGGVDRKVASNQTIADTIQIVSTSLLGLTVACSQCHDHRYDPIPQTDYYRMRAIFEPALDWKNWRPPVRRRISLYTDSDRELAKQINAEAAKVDAERAKKTEHYITRTLEEELLLVPQSLREPLRMAYRSPAKTRTPEQKALLKEYPSVASISAGSLYLYDRRRAAKAAQFDAARKRKLPKFVAQTAARELRKVPAEERTAVETALKISAKSRSAAQLELIGRFPGVAVTAATLGKFNPEAAAELKKLADDAMRLRSEKAADDLKRFTERAAAIRDKIPREGFIRALTEAPGKVPVTHVFHRGDHEQPKQIVVPGELTVVALTAKTQIPANDSSIPTTGRRLAYARSLTNGRHPLTARVIVNRIWLHHFGRGLVESPGDFGFLGQRPTHPELLDWLASDFMQSGWRIKRLHRLIMTSTAYRQSSRRRAKLDAVDPDNRLYGRMNIWRLESESLRDAVLFVSGRLNEKLYGDPIPVMEDEVGQIVLGKENLDGERKPTAQIDLQGEEFRRSLYVQVRRSRPLGVLEAFDTPTMSPNCTRRNKSNVAPQSLMLMNSTFVIDYSARFAERVVNDVGTDRRLQIVRAWIVAFGREPEADEITSTEQFLNRQTAAFRKSMKNTKQAEQRALATFCQALLSSNRFLYVD